MEGHKDESKDLLPNSKYQSGRQARRFLTLKLQPQRFSGLRNTKENVKLEEGRKKDGARILTITFFDDKKRPFRYHLNINAFLSFASMVALHQHAEQKSIKSTVNSSLSKKRIIIKDLEEFANVDLERSTSFQKGHIFLHPVDEWKLEKEYPTYVEKQKDLHRLRLFGRFGELPYIQTYHKFVKKKRSAGKDIDRIWEKTINNKS